MITKIKEVYYCEFCKKRYLSKYFMANHEKYCTVNPDRECGMCEFGDIKDLIEKYSNSYILKDLDQSPFAFGGQTIEWIKEFILKDIQDDVEGCPVCTLAILRICKLTHYLTMDKFKFDYKKEVEDWWKDHQPEPDYGCY